MCDESPTCPDPCYPGATSAGVPENAHPIEIKCNQEREPNPCPCPTKLRYVQPPRRESCKPCIKFKHPDVPMEHDTIYKNSYPGVDSKMAANCRMPPALPQNQLQSSSAKMDTTTVTELSFPGHFCVTQQKPIIPCPRSMLGEGPMQDLTTQKHDFVVKPFSKRSIIIPPDKMMRTCESLSNKTVNRLSFMAPNMERFSKAISFKPVTCYHKPEVPMEVNTTQKMSFMPVCPPPKEDYPWAKRAKFMAPTIPVEKETTYKLSYPANDGDQRSKICWPVSNPKLITANACFDPHTIYKESYLLTNGERPKPILPQPQLKIDKSKMDCNTCYQMAYPGHAPMERRKPIIPCPPSMLGEGPMQDLTTQKHDFIQKPFSKRKLIMPNDLMMRTCASLEKETTSKLSYMKPNMERFVKPVSFKPITCYNRPEVPMDVNTTQKMSFMPVCPPQKIIYPWAARPKFQQPNIPMETETVQKMSFGPPGCFIEDTTGCFCDIPKQNAAYPKAGIVRGCA